MGRQTEAVYRAGVPYAPPQLVIAAVAALEGAHPLVVVSIPALLRTAQGAVLDPVAEGVPFRSTQETELLDDFFQLPRPPDPERPWRAPWSSQDPWQKRKYPGGTLQRLRTDAAGKGRILQQTKVSTGGPDLWQLTPHAGAELMSQGQYTKARLVDLALWFGRNRDVADLDDLFKWFTKTFNVYVADLVGTIYDDTIPSAYYQESFATAPIGDATNQTFGSLPPAPTVQGNLYTLIEKLEHYLDNNGYRRPEGIVQRVVTAWMRGDIVVLVGQPGTGKTLFAGLMGRAMEKELALEAPLLIPVRADFDESEFIGYERLDGSAQLREFSTEILKTARPLEARVIVLEEFNLALVETYLASVLVAAQERERSIRLPAGEQASLPIDTFIIATCNSYRDEPETRTRVSTPTKRRSTIITMPNVLGDRFMADRENAVLELALRVVLEETRRVKDRVVAGQGAQFDSLRVSALESVVKLDDLSAAVREALVKISAAILDTATGRSWFTLGLLKDVILEIVYSERNERAEMVALGQAVADKLIHQLRGSHSDVEDLRFTCAELPNAEEIDQLIARMTDGPSDQLIPLV